GDEAADGAAAAGGEDVHGSVPRHADADPGSDHEGPESGPAGARDPLHALHLQAVRIAFDVSPLSHPRTGVGNYIRGSLAGLTETAAGEHEVVAFAPTSPQGLKAIPRALEGIPVETRLRFLPF